MNTLKTAIHLMGNTCNQPIITINTLGNKIAHFNMATKANTNSPNGEKIITTHWHKLIAIGKAAEMVEQFVSKGAQIAVAGKLVNRTYKDANGYKKFSTAIIAFEVLLINQKAIA